MNRQDNLVDFLVKKGALEFGNYILRSGRESTYFFDTGKITDASGLSRLGRELVSQLPENTDIIFGPAYKGIPLAIVTCMRLFNSGGPDLEYAFNRKEEKTHGDKNRIIGAEIRDDFNIALVDDSFTTGGTQYESVDLLRNTARVKIEKLIVLLDRQEVDLNGNDAVEEFTKKTGVYVSPVLSIRDFHDYFLRNNHPEKAKKIEEHLKKYGAKESTKWIN